MGKALVSVTGACGQDHDSSSSYKMLYTRLLKSLFAFVFVLKINIKIALNAASHSALLNIARAQARC